MKFYKKIRIHEPNYVCRKYKFCGITLFKKEISVYVSMWILGIRFAKFKNKKHIQNIPTSQEDTRLFLDSISPQKKTVLWIDHSLGGGTDTYSRNVFEEGLSSTNFIRMQFFAYNCCKIIDRKMHSYTASVRLTAYSGDSAPTEI